MASNTAKARALGLVKDHEAPQEAPPETVKVELNGTLVGHWTEIRREVSGRQMIALLRASEDFAPVLEAIGSRTVAHSFGGDILDQPISVLTKVLNAWTEHDRNAAVDPTSASD